MYEVVEQVVSHGWLVVAPEHTGNSWHSAPGDLLQMPYRRPDDVADTFDALLAEVQRPGSSLAGCVDPAAGYVVAGSSFGGYTAYVTGGALVDDPIAPTLDLSDPAVRAVVAFVPWDAFGLLSRGTRSVDVPVLSFGGERDTTVGTTYLDLWSHLTTEPRVGYSFPDGGHMTFTPIWCVQPGNGCGPSYVDQTVAVETAFTATLAFLEHLRGRSGALRQMPVFGPFTWDQAGLP
jgi:predicted dienelactone hydrolase